MFEEECVENIRTRAIEESKNFIEQPNQTSNSFLVIKIYNNSIKIIQKPNMLNKLLNDRCNIVCDFFKNLIEKYEILYKGNITIGLNDDYDNSYKGIFVFSRKKRNKKQILLPDVYAMSNYSGKLEIKDKQDFNDKIHKAIFIGHATGDVNIEQNERIKLCKWALDKIYCDAFISNALHFKVEKILEQGNFLLTENIPIEKQMEYKFQICMDGNTCAWDRFVWQLNSNSITLKQSSDNINWYYPLMEKNKEYIEFESFDDITNILRNNSNDYKTIIKNANSFVKNYLTYECHQFYTAVLLNNIY
jgi:hypothetical protein